MKQDKKKLTDVVYVSLRERLKESQEDARREKIQNWYLPSVVC